jgi:hypothetical protein
VNIASIVGGLVCISVTTWGKKFATADVEGFPINDNKEVSTWSGKLVFGAAGIRLGDDWNSETPGPWLEPEFANAASS